jgi:hypothetical protein
MKLVRGRQVDRDRVTQSDRTDRNGQKHKERGGRDVEGDSRD